MRKFVIFLSVLLISIGASAAKTIIIPDSKTKTISEKWVETTFNTSNPPFSFYLDNKHSSTFIKKWKREFKRVRSFKKNQTRYNVIFTSPNGNMEITCDIAIFKDYPAVEWKLYFKNNGDNNSKKIRDISCSDIALPFGKSAEYTIYTAKGSSVKDYDFHPVKKSVLRDSTYHFANYGGKSTSGEGFPYYNVTADNNRGAMIAIGWTGNWRCDFAIDKYNSITMSAGMPGQDMYLYSGEQFRTPSIVILFWRGKDRIDGNNYWRQFMLSHYTPKDSKGNMITPPTAGSFDYLDPKPIGEYEGLTETFARACIERYKRFGIVPDVFWLDAGWFGELNAPLNTPRTPWYRQVGSWEPNPERFPNGLKPIADDIHKLGSKFMLWYEPETVSINTTFDKELPKEWILRSKTYRPKDAIVNLAIPEARKFITVHITNSLHANGVDYYRQDFNLYPNNLWPLADTPDRKGATEVHYIEGLYKFWDDLKREFPDMLIDNCSGGGMRLDIEMMSRSYPLWRTDCNYGEPTCQQSHNYGLAQFLPVHGTGIFYADDYCIHSALGPTMVFNIEIFGRDAQLSQLQKVINTHKKYKSYFWADYYPLSGDGSTLGKDINLATQWNRPSDDSGLIVLFRRDESPNESITVKLKGLDANAIYRIKDTDSGEITEHRGADLMNGVTFKIGPKRSSRLLHYSK